MKRAFIAMCLILGLFSSAAQAQDRGRVTVANQLTEPSNALVVEVFVKKDNGNSQRIRYAIPNGQTKAFAVPYGDHEIQFTRTKLHNENGKPMKPSIVRMKQSLSLSANDFEKSFEIGEGSMKATAATGKKKKK